MAGVRSRGGVSSTQSPVVSVAVTRLHHYTKARSAIRWGMASSFAMLLLLADMYLCSIAFLTSINKSIILLIESILLAILFLAVLYDLVYFLSVILGNPGVKVTPSQKTMLGISPSITGFQTVSTPVRSTLTSTPTSYNNANSTKTTPHLTTPFTPPTHHHYSPAGSIYGTPPAYHSTPHTPPNNTSYIMYGTPPQRSPSSAMSMSPFADDRISSRNSLIEYLKSEEEREHKLTQNSSPDLLLCDSSWSSPGGSSSLRKYHVATRNSMPLERDEQEGTNSLWSRLHIKKEDLSEWTERCRKWLAQTIIVLVSKEIKSVNKKLEDMGSKEVMIGVASLDQLESIARLRMTTLTSLGMLIRYLKVSSNQDYLIKRIHDLAEGASISNYKWDSGGTWKGRKWDQDLPTDSQIVLHFLCTYLDTQIPHSPQFPDGKTFSCQYFLKTPEKPNNKKSTVAIYQSSIYPPHFKVLWKDTCIEVPKGRNNLFYAVIVFLHYVKKEEKGLLGHMDLELSGLNLLWIIGKK